MHKINNYITLKTIFYIFTKHSIQNSIGKFFIVISLALISAACQNKIWPGTENDDELTDIKVERFDRLQCRYLTTGDFSALQQMNTNYPMETRTLIENMLQLGTVNQSDINERFLKFYQDTTLQHIISEAELQYANMDDINEQLTKAFQCLLKEMPNVEIPVFYAQIGALDQSIIVGDGIIGISLDKYLGSDYTPYHRYYAKGQLQTMNRENIVPDCLTFYLLSLFPLENFETAPQDVRDAHIGRVMWVVNKLMGQQFFKDENVKKVSRFMSANKKLSIKQLLQQ